ncbi:hypothetical protein ACFOWE_16435 [Planomonospora corallina]|uniref:Uncharacterized protein n=1 Tax=Planomonospora corallina TaxID=1806052 RepID=A0ABV8I951_9ACTN
MILISAGLVLTAVVLLIAGVVLAKPFLVMWSIAVSVLSAVFLVIGALLRRHELFPGRGRAGAALKSPYGGPVPAGPMHAGPMAPHQHHVAGVPGVAGVPAGAPQSGRQAAATRTRPAPAAAARQGPLDAEAIVLVIPGRRRYHLAGCRQLAGRDHEELTCEEAREEGFTPCTTCLPEFSAPQEDPREQEPTGPQALHESGPAGAAGPAAGETVRFTPPYRPVASGPSQEPPAVRDRAAATPSGESREQAASASLAGEPAPGPSARPSAPEPEDSAATGWFGRDAAAARPPAPDPVPDPAVPGPETAVRPAAEPEDASAGSGAVTGTERAEKAAGETTVSPAGETADGPAAEPAGADPETAGEPAEETAVWRVPPAPGDRAERPSGGREAPAAPETAEKAVKAADRTTPDTAEPVEPAGTEPGRAGQSVPTGSTSAEPSPGPSTEPSSGPSAGSGAGSAEGEATPPGEPEEARGGTPVGEETSPHGIPAVAEDAEPETVSVIVGTRRFHGPTCPLIRGVDDDGVETMSRAEAEKAGLSGCAVCQNG